MAHFLRRSGAIAALALLSALPGCGEENKYEPPPAPKVGVAQPAKQAVTRYLELTGNTVSLDKVELVARVAGFLREINYKDGSMVKKGDVLFVIEPAPYEAKVQQAEAEVAAAKATADFAEAEFQRQDALSRTTQFGWQSKFYEAQKNRDEKRAHVQKGTGLAGTGENRAGLHQGDGAVRRNRDDPSRGGRRAGWRRQADTARDDPAARSDLRQGEPQRTGRVAHHRRSQAASAPPIWARSRSSWG